MLTWLISRYSLCGTGFSCMFKDIAGYKSKHTTHLFYKELNGLLMESCFILFIIEYLFFFCFFASHQNTKLFSHSQWVIYIEKVNLGESSFSDFRFWIASKWEAGMERTSTKAAGTCEEYQVLSLDFLISFQGKCSGNYNNVPDSAQILNIVDFSKN